MINQDAKNREKIDNNEREDAEFKGLLRVIKEGTPLVGEARRMQEHHNANHALWYLSLALYCLLEGNAKWHNQKKVERLIAHLGHLREFIEDYEFAKRAAVQKLYWTLETDLPANDRQWRAFFYKYWQLIRFFAQCYGQHDKCFPEDYHQKLRDLHEGAYWCKHWWWRSCQKRFQRTFMRLS